MTTAPLADWKRSYFKQPADPNALYFVVYGPIIENFSFSGGDYRVNYMPENLNISSFNVQEHAEQLNQFRQGIFADLLKKQQPELVKTVEKQDSCYIVQAVFPDTDTLNDHRCVIGIISYLLDCGAVAVFDLFARYWFSPSEWQEKIFKPEEFSPFGHAQINVSMEHNGSEWIYTHGMRKFGRPDLSIHYVCEEEKAAVLEMMNRFIAFMAAGGLIEQHQEIRMQGLPQGMFCNHTGNMDDPEFNNTHIEISWPNPDA